MWMEAIPELEFQYCHCSALIEYSSSWREVQRGTSSPAPASSELIMQILQQGGHCLPDNAQRNNNRDNSWESDAEREQKAQRKGSFHLYRVCEYGEYTEKCAINNIQKCRHVSTGKHWLWNSSVLPFPRISCTKIEAWSSCSLAGLARDPASDTDLLSELVMVTLPQI